MNLHERIMNLPAKAPKHWGEKALVDAHAVGHAQGRHAAAELALLADVCIESLRRLLMAGNEYKSFDGGQPAWHVKSIPRDADLDRAREALAALDR